MVFAALASAVVSVQPDGAAIVLAMVLFELVHSPLLLLSLLVHPIGEEQLKS